MANLNEYSRPQIVVNNDHLESTSFTAPLKSHGSDGTSGGMDGRITALEKRFDRFETKLDGLVKDVSEMKGRLSGMPTTWQLLGMVLAIMGASFAIIRFGLPH